MLVPIVTLTGLKVVESLRTKAAHRASRAARGRQAVAAVRAVGTAVRQLPSTFTTDDLEPAEGLHDEGAEEEGAADWVSPADEEDALVGGGELVVVEEDGLEALDAGEDRPVRPPAKETIKVSF